MAEESGRDMAWSWASSVAPDPGAPAAARSFVEQSLKSAYRPSEDHRVADLCEDLVVIVSELVTNAVQARTVTLQVEMAIEGPTVRLAVTDAAAGMPTVTGPAASSQPYGRGLAIVAALSQDWGVVPVAAPADGKTVWARLPVPFLPGS